MGKQHVRDDWISIRQQKTGVLVDIPILDELQSIIGASPTGELTFIVTEFNKPFSTKGLGNKMRDWCDQAGLPQCSSHGLSRGGRTP